MKKLLTVLLAVSAAFAAMAVDPIVLTAEVRQNWPWDTRIMVVYDLLWTQGHGVAVSVSAKNGQRPLAIPPAALSGELVAYSDGRHALVIDAAQILGAGEVAADFSVSLTAVPVAMDAKEVLYKVLDLADGTVTDVTRGDLASGRLGAVAVSYEWATPSIDNVPAQQFMVWTEPASNDVYKTSKIVLRRCPSGTFRMGVGDVRSAGTETTITEDFFIGIFEMTQGQCERIKPGLATFYFANPSCAAVRPAGNVTFDMIRGGTKGRLWPEGFDTSVDDGTYLAALRALTGDDGWDLPTEAEWEYAERATTETTYNNGYNGTSNDETAKWVARNKANAGTPTAASDLTAGTAAVGSYCPNPWGIYDCHGNVWEWTRDRYVATVPGGRDPVGGDTDANASDRTAKGGGYIGGHTNMQSGNRHKAAANSTKDPSATSNVDVDSVGWRVMWRGR